MDVPPSGTDDTAPCLDDEFPFSFFGVMILRFQPLVFGLGCRIQTNMLRGVFGK